MAHDVFISHSAKNKPTADAVCAMLESEGIRCWIAPRDVVPGMEWGECIIDAIEQTRIMVLIFTADANASPQIRREVERAVNHGVAILPLRMEDVLPGKALEYFIGNVHWLDAITPPLEAHLRQLAGTIKLLLSRIPSRQDPRGPESGPAGAQAQRAIAASQEPNMTPPARSPELAQEVVELPPEPAPTSVAILGPQPASAGAPNEAAGAVNEPTERSETAVPPVGAYFADGAPEITRPRQRFALVFAAVALAVGLLVFLATRPHRNPTAQAPPETPAAQEPPHRAQVTSGPAQIPKTSPSAAAPQELARQAMTLLEHQRYAEAKPIAQKACGGGNALGCFDLGYLYDHGQPKDFSRAATFYQKACDLKHAAACAELADLYDTGQGVAQDFAQAVSLYKTACDLGAMNACTLAGFEYEHGYEVPQDYEQAALFYRKGCGLRGGDSCRHLGSLYLAGHGVPQDVAEARSLYTKACGLGDTDSCDRLSKIAN